MWLVVAALLGGMAAAMVTTAVRQTPTIDEPVYVATAVVYTEQHSLRYNPEHPPLGKLIVAAGLAFTGAHLDPDFRGNQTALGRRLLYESGHDPHRLMLAARLPVIALTLLFGLVVFLFARDLTNPVGGLLACALYAFSPDVVAHGSLATLDVPAAGFLLTSVWLLWRATERPALHLALAGAALGAACATKASMLVAVPVLLALAAWRGGRRRWWLAGVFAAAAVAVVWASYLAVDPQLRWTPPPNLPAVPGLRGLALDLLPFPRAYADGMRIQLGFEDRTYGGFLFGREYRGSLWYYLPAAVLVKTPLGALALWAAGAVTLLAVRRLRPAAPFVLAPAAVLSVAAVFGARDYGTRYVIVLPMFLAVAAAAVVLLRWRWAPAAAAALAGFVAVSSALTFPHYLPYANEAFGGPARTSRHLHDSNVDWGQDLGLLAAHLREHYPGEPVWLVYKGAGSPAWYGLPTDDPTRVPPGRVRGLLVVSDSRVARPGAKLAALLRDADEIDDVGHSITIFRR
ncbi:glycosyl transferase [Spirilliplanes yamanashiensis]|uniref:Glycosyl transferase n=1 Tax=Spirilliplanes yamanashiensis TaxID=42233 RepID=A0A8J3Y8E1_9ACTN|nr:glycosyl transferase [Spirilliplanes yamanashiensis]